MSRCAVVSNLDNKVVNIIMAEPTDIPPEGTFLVGLEENQFLDIGWFYDNTTNSFNNPIVDEV